MDPMLIFLVILLPALLLVIALCSASETAFFSLTRADRIKLRRVRPGSGLAVQRILKNPRKLVLSVLFITNTASVTFYVVVTILEHRIANEALGVAFNIGILLMLILLADVLPKLVASSSPVRLAGVLSRPLEGALRVIGPVIDFLEWFIISPLIRLFRTGPGDESQPGTVSVDELGTLLELSAGSGEIERDEQKLLADVIRLGSIRVRDVMVPRVSMPWVSDRFVPADVARVIKRTNADRIPVFRGSPDGKPVGWLEPWKYLARAEQTEPRATAGAFSAAALEPIAFVPERARMDQLIELLRRRRCEQALCVDEYGAVVGLISILEVIRELVAAGPGAEGGASAAIERRSDRCWVVPGRLPARELAAQLGAPAAGGGEVSTVAGLFFQRLGRVPAVGDSMRMGNVELRVESMTGRSISTVALTLLSGGKP